MGTGWGLRDQGQGTVAARPRGAHTVQSRASEICCVSFLSPRTHMGQVTFSARGSSWLHLCLPKSSSIFLGAPSPTVTPPGSPYISHASVSAGPCLPPPSDRGLHCQWVTLGGTSLPCSFCVPYLNPEPSTVHGSPRVACHSVGFGFCRALKRSTQGLLLKSSDQRLQGRGLPSSGDGNPDPRLGRWPQKLGEFG